MFSERISFSGHPLPPPRPWPNFTHSFFRSFDVLRFLSYSTYPPGHSVGRQAILPALQDSPVFENRLRAITSPKFFKSQLCVPLGGRVIESFSRVSSRESARNSTSW